MTSARSHYNIPGDGMAYNVLIVDDNKEIVYSISELLKYEGYETLKAYDGMEALDIMERENVDLILLDVMMPRLNGLSALDETAVRKAESR